MHTSTGTLNLSFVVNKSSLWAVLPLVCVACSSETKQVETKEAPAVATAKEAAASSSPIDEKNGFRDHHFGDNISTFPGLVPLTKYNSDADLKRYEMPKGQENLTVGDAKLAKIIYDFYRGKFSAVLVSTDEKDKANDEKLRAAVISLYGPGQSASSRDNIYWLGKKVTGSFKSVPVFGLVIGQLSLKSKAIEDEQEAEKLKTGKTAARDL